MTAALCKDSLEHIESNVAILCRTLSKATFGDLLDAAVAPWKPLKAALVAAPSIARLQEIDALAERLLTQSEALTRTLETAGFAAALHVINVSGRQRMLSQRLAKFAVISSLTKGQNGPVEKGTEKAFVDGFDYLRKIPLSTPEIRALLDDAAAAWTAFQKALLTGDAPAREQIAVLSETLLAQFDRLTDLYERSMQMLME